MVSLKKLINSVLAEDNKHSKIKQSYLKRTPISAEKFLTAESFEPSGVSRQVGRWSPYPLTLVRGEGPFLWDVDGNRYIDMLGNYTSLVHGNNYKPIHEEINRVVSSGTAWAANNLYQSELAQQLVQRVDGVDQVRFTNSGTEAGNLALLIARALTGRYGVLMARFGYHGGLQEFEVGSFNLGGPHTYMAEYGNAASFEAVLQQHSEKISAIFVEGVLGAGGMCPAPASFFIELKKMANKFGVLLVIDEVISLRLGFGGQQGNLAVTADLTMMGKLIGGGFPVGAVGGSREIMKVFDPNNLQVWHSGTFNGNPVTMAAGNVSVRELTVERIDIMNQLGLKLVKGMRCSARKYGLPFSVNHSGSLLNIFFSEHTPEDITTREDHRMITKFHLACLNHGVTIASRGMFVLSTIMDSAIIQEALERIDLAMKDLADEI